MKNNIETVQICRVETTLSKEGYLTRIHNIQFVDSGEEYLNYNHGPLKHSELMKIKEVDKKETGVITIFTFCFPDTEFLAKHVLSDEISKRYRESLEHSSLLEQGFEKHGTTCITCGVDFFGKPYKVYDENDNWHEGDYECSSCYADRF